MNKQAAKLNRIAVSAFFFVSGFSFATWAARIPTLQQQLGLNDAELGSVLFALPLGLIVTMPLAGILLNKYNSKRILVYSGALYTIFLCLLGVAKETWQVVILLFMFGGARNFFNISINTQSVGVQALYSKSIIAFFHGIWGLAGFAGAAFASLMLTLNISVLLHFVIVSCFTSVVMMVSYKHTLHTDIRTETNRKFSFSIPDKPVLMLGLIGFFSMLCEGTMSEWTGIYYMKEVQTDTWLITGGYIAYLTAMTIGRFVGDNIINKYGPTTVLKLSSVLIATGCLMLIFLPYIVPATVGCFVVGAGVSCIMPLVFSLTAKNSILSAGPAIASVSTVSYLGMLVGPSVVGFLSQLTNLRYAFGLIVFLALTVLYMISRFRKTG